jgi:hypothetical protein
VVAEKVQSWAGQDYATGFASEGEKKEKGEDVPATLDVI